MSGVGVAAFDPGFDQPFTTHLVDQFNECLGNTPDKAFIKGGDHQCCAIGAGLEPRIAADRCPGMRCFNLGKT